MWLISPALALRSEGADQSPAERAFSLHTERRSTLSHPFTRATPAVCLRQNSASVLKWCLHDNMTRQTHTNSLTHTHLSTRSTNPVSVTHTFRCSKKQQSVLMRSVEGSQPPDESCPSAHDTLLSWRNTLIRSPFPGRNHLQERNYMITLFSDGICNNENRTYIKSI